MKSEMEQTSKRRRRKKQGWENGSIPANELTDLIESEKSSNKEPVQRPGSEERKPFEVLHKRPTAEVTAGPAVPDDSKSQPVTRVGAVAPSVAINTEELPVVKAVHWQDSDGKHHRIDGEHRAEADRHFVARAELQEFRANYEQERRTSATELAQLASEIAEVKGQRSQFAFELPQQLRIDQGHEDTLRSERLALIRERELLVRERELLVQEREMLAADRKQLSLELQARADRETRVEQPSTQSVDLAETLTAVNQQFGIPVHEKPSKNLLDDGSRSADSTHLSTPLDPAQLPEVDQGASKADQSRAEDPAISSLTSAQQYVLEPEQPINDLRSHLAKLFELPTSTSAEQSAATQVDAFTGQIESETESVEQTDSVTEMAAESPVDVSEANHSTGDDSVDEYMARLLARSRGQAVAVERSHENVPLESKAWVPVIEWPTTIQEQAAQDASDLLRLASEPKHKQDKLAARGNLNLFREVALSSARSALARHSLRQMRSAIITKGTILVLSLSAAAVVLFEPVLGSPVDIGVAMVCCLAALLSGLDIHRSWRQFRKPILSSWVRGITD